MKIYKIYKMNDGMYLEAMDQLKELNDKREKELEQLKEDNMEIKT